MTWPLERLSEPKTLCAEPGEQNRASWTSIRSSCRTDHNIQKFLDGLTGLPTISAKILSLNPLLAADRFNFLTADPSWRQCWVCLPFPCQLTYSEALLAERSLCWLLCSVTVLCDLSYSFKVDFLSLNSDQRHLCPALTRFPVTMKQISDTLLYGSSWPRLSELWYFCIWRQAAQPLAHYWVEKLLGKSWHFASVQLGHLCPFF